MPGLSGLETAEVILPEDATQAVMASPPPSTRRSDGLQQGEDITHAYEIVPEALRRGDKRGFWLAVSAADYDYSALDLLGSAG
jgi:hypothetical protein